jgi:hypothetical protein
MYQPSQPRVSRVFRYCNIEKGWEGRGPYAFLENCFNNKVNDCSFVEKSDKKQKRLPAVLLGAESLFVNSSTIAGNTHPYQKLSTFLHKEAMNSLSNNIDVPPISGVKKASLGG